MRIERLTLNNYRQFKDVEIEFNLKGENDLHVIIGKNGTCKTNILNAINWCLYGDEPHFSKESQKLPILNVKAIDDVTKEGHLEKVNVTLCVRTSDGKYVTFERTSKFHVHTDGRQPTHQSTDFQVEATDDDDNTKFYTDEEADKHVERFVPKRIREFFFFDGARMGQLFLISL